MSAAIIIGLGIPLIAFTAVTLSDSEFVRIIKELVNILVRTTNYSAEKIFQIIKFYL